ncbi:hypothetical protein K439DRAFT_1624251 [Ramaria rubella]|nr:hypothetical protein K439DRAFT_1624251 [Ramaria rubella]
MDENMYKIYASSGKNYCIIQKVASELEEQAQYAHNVCGVEVFSVVYEPGYGDLNATAANTIFAGSQEIASVLASKGVAGKALIGEIQAFVGIKLHQDKQKHSACASGKNCDDLRRDVQRHFHSCFFGENADSSKHVPEMRMSNWLFTEQKHLRRWPSAIRWSPFNLNKLSVEEVRLLVKANVVMEDWTDST